MSTAVESTAFESTAFTSTAVGAMMAGSLHSTMAKISREISVSIASLGFV